MGEISGEGLINHIILRELIDRAREQTITGGGCEAGRYADSALRNRNSWYASDARYSDPGMCPDRETREGGCPVA